MEPGRAFGPGLFRCRPLAGNAALDRGRSPEPRRPDEL